MKRIQTTPFHQLFLFGIYLTTVFALAGCTTLQKAFREPTPTPRPTSVAQVSPDQIAQAMQADSFYATYGSSELIVTGTVASVEPQGDGERVEFVMAGAMKVQCQLSSSPSNLQPGEKITARITDPRHNVVRQDGGVLLNNCTLIN